MMKTCDESPATGKGARAAVIVAIWQSTHFPGRTKATAGQSPSPKTTQLVDALRPSPSYVAWPSRSGWLKYRASSSFARGCASASTQTASRLSPPIAAPPTNAMSGEWRTCSDQFGHLTSVVCNLSCSRRAKVSCWPLGTRNEKLLQRGGSTSYDRCNTDSNIERRSCSYGHRRYNRLPSRLHAPDRWN
jgi:hypothetical protein